MKRQQVEKLGVTGDDTAIGAAASGAASTGAAASQRYTDKVFQSDDGLQLHYRDHAADSTADRLPIVCLPGLVGNAREYDHLAQRIAPSRRVLAVDLRGRGSSEQARDQTGYTIDRHIDDLRQLLEREGIARAVIIGTSLGGVLAMLLARIDPFLVAAAVLNEAGPVMGREGLARNSGGTLQNRSFPTWMHAARALQEAQAQDHPGWQLDQWIAHAKRLMSAGGNGRIALDCDSRAGDELHVMEDGLPTVRNEQSGRAQGAGADWWNVLDALASCPVLVVRGETSDVLSAATAQAMVDRLPDAELLTVRDTGHAPTLNEPVAQAAILRMLERTD
ncbi:alpha/beta hydrolase [Croceicoccus sp. F390]|uniref:Alpha/beta hydrolase n=1 Tax=Croceicoccus esteveae TaxID=3075597 RepID=A0ABU2ZG90_9SPHN|nr:alpha/beta hydrolase [Croceicoccus sp. F390]MDT0575329.1 alpha/beta hydrolase [Croceicoccus sp. F390]